MKKIVMMLIIFILVVVVFILGINIVKPKISSLHTSFYGETRTFYATIKEVREYEGITTLLVEGIESNDINHRGNFTFSVNDTRVLWKGATVSTSYLKKGMLITIGKYDYVQETYPAKLVNVKSIIILQDELK